MAKPRGTTRKPASTEAPKVVKRQSGSRPSQAIRSRPIINQSMESDPERSVLETFLKAKNPIGVVANGPGRLAKIMARGHGQINLQKLEEQVRQAIRNNLIVSSPTGGSRHYKPAS